MSSETESGSPTQGIPEEGARRGGVMLVESLPEEGTYLLRALKAEELFQLVHGCMSQRTEKKLDELREELSPDIVDGALDGLFQALTGESESTSRSPSSAEESSSDRSEVWEKIKALYHKLNLFNPSETGVSGLKLPTPKLKVEKLRKVSKKIKTKLSCLKVEKEEEETPEAPATQSEPAEKEAQDGEGVSESESPAPKMCLPAIKLKAAGDRFKRRTRARISGMMKPVRGRASRRIHSGVKIQTSDRKLLRAKIAELPSTRLPGLQAGIRSASKVRAAGAHAVRKSCQKILSTKRKIHFPSMEKGRRSLQTFTAAGGRLLRKSQEKVQNADLTSCLPMESGRRSLKKLKAAGGKLLRRSSEEVHSPEEDVESNEDADSELEEPQTTDPRFQFVQSGKRRAANLKAAGAKILRKSREKVQNADLLCCFPMESGKRYAAKAEESDLKKAVKESLKLMISHVVSEAGFERHSHQFIFPIDDIVEKIWKEVKNERFQMDQTTIVNKLHLLVYKDLLKEWKKAQYLLIFMHSGSEMVNDFISFSFKKHLTAPKKPSLFRRFLNFFRRSD